MQQSRNGQTKLSNTDKYLGIELLRFVMAVSVIALHLCNWIATPSSDLLTLLILRTGELAVPTFWCLSGFIFYAVYSKRISDHHLTFKHFVVGRFTRLYPLAFASLVLTLALNEVYIKYYKQSFVWHRGDAYHFVLNMFLASHWGLQKFTAFNGPIWSISVEILIYGLFFLVVRILGNSSWIAAVMFILGKVLSHIEPNLTHFYSLSTCVQCFFIGSLVKSLYSYLQTNYQRQMPYFALVVGTCIIITFTQSNRNISFQIVPPLSVLLFQSISSLIPNHFNKFIEVLGSVTYASYLLHYPLLLSVVMTMDCQQIPRPYLTTSSGMIMFLFIVMIMSKIVYVYFEQPIQHILRTQMTLDR